MAIWIFGGLMALMGTLSTAELAIQFPHTGGDFLYLRRLYGRYPAFLYGWMSLFVFASGSIGILAMFSAKYAGEIFPILPDKGITAELLASIIIVFYTFLHSLKITIGSRFQTILTVTKAVGIILLGYVLLSASSNISPVKPEDSTTVFSFQGFARALVPVFFAYSGWNAVGYVAGDVKKPEKTLPIAFICGTTITLLLYLFINFAFLSVLGLNGMQGDPMVPLTALRALSVYRWELFLTVLIFISVFSSLSVAVQVGARVIQSMGENGVFFKKVATLHYSWKTPVVALVIQGVWSIILIHLLDLEKLVDSTTVVMVLFSALTISSLLKAHKMRSEMNHYGGKQFHTPLFPLIPFAYIISCLFISIGVIQYYLSLGSFLPFWGFGFVVVGTIIFIFWRKVSF